MLECFNFLIGYRPVIRRMCPRGVLESRPYKKSSFFRGLQRPFSCKWGNGMVIFGISDHFPINSSNLHLEIVCFQKKTTRQSESRYFKNWIGVKHGKQVFVYKLRAFHQELVDPLFLFDKLIAYALVQSRKKYEKTLRGFL